MTFVLSLEVHEKVSGIHGVAPAGRTGAGVVTPQLPHPENRGHSREPGLVNVGVLTMPLLLGHGMGVSILQIRN